MSFQLKFLSRQLTPFIPIKQKQSAQNGIFFLSSPKNQAKRSKWHFFFLLLRKIFNENSKPKLISFPPLVLSNPQTYSSVRSWQGSSEPKESISRLYNQRNSVHTLILAMTNLRCVSDHSQLQTPQRTTVINHHD